jgi:uncharacterized protein YuzE
MKIDFDVESDAMYLQLVASAIQESQEIAPGIIADFNLQGEMVGLEILSFKRKTRHQILSIDIPFQSNLDRQTFEQFLAEHATESVIPC